MFSAGDRVYIKAWQKDPRTADRTGYIIDGVPPGPLTKSRSTVKAGAH